MSIGINSGPVLYGPVGAKRVNRFDFTVIGDAVNVAARLQAKAGPGDILVTEAFANLISDEFSLNEFGVHEIKGKPDPVKLFKVLDISD